MNKGKIATLLDTNDLKAKNVVKNLGVLIDNDTSFNNHIRALTK